MNVIAFVCAEVRSIIATYRSNSELTKNPQSSCIDIRIPCGAWCHEDAVEPVINRIITKKHDREETERILNEYRLAKYKERSIFRRKGDGAETIQSIIPKRASPIIKQDATVTPIKKAKKPQ